MDDPLVPLVPVPSPPPPDVPDDPAPPLPDVIPVMLTEVPSLLYKIKVLDPEKYVPPVTQQSSGKILQLASCLVTPLIPSIVDPVQDETNNSPAGVFAFTTLPKSD